MAAVAGTNLACCACNTRSAARSARHNLGISPSKLALPSALRAGRRRSAAPLRVRAVVDPEGEQPVQAGASLKTQVDDFLQRYDFLSAGMGALAVTTFCVAGGQSPGEAAVITVTSTIAALVLGELLFDGEQ